MSTCDEINDDFKLVIYDILNKCKNTYYKAKNPYDILHSAIKPTYNTIQLEYIKDKKYFVEKAKFATFKQNKSNNFTPEETAAYQERKKKRENFTPEETAAYLERKKNKPVFTAEETAAYLERKKRRDGGVYIL